MFTFGDQDYHDDVYLMILGGGQKQIEDEMNQLAASVIKGMAAGLPVVGIDYGSRPRRENWKVRWHGLPEKFLQ